MRFLIDAQLPPGLARWLGERGHRAEHVNELGLGAAPDSVIEARARELRAVIWSKDADFADRARRTPGLQVVSIARSLATRAASLAGRSSGSA